MHLRGWEKGWAAAKSHCDRRRSAASFFSPGLVSTHMQCRASRPLAWCVHAHAHARNGIPVEHDLCSAAPSLQALVISTHERPATRGGCGFQECISPPAHARRLLISRTRLAPPKNLPRTSLGATLSRLLEFTSGNKSLIGVRGVCHRDASSGYGGKGFGYGES